MGEKSEVHSFLWLTVVTDSQLPVKMHTELDMNFLISTGPIDIFYSS